MQRLILLLCLAACGGSAAESSGSGGPPPAPVEVARAQPGVLDDAWALPGEVRALGDADLAAQVTGQIDAVLAREGASVARGDALVRIDDALVRARHQAARAAADEASANAEVARRDLERLARVSAGVVSEAERDAADARARAADARAEAARAEAEALAVELRRHTVRAPFDGVVTRRDVDPGDHVLPGAALMRLVSTEDVEVVVDGPPALLEGIAPGASATVGDAVTAEVVAIVPALDPATRTVRARLSVPGDAGLVPGSTVDVRLPFTRRDGQVVVPRDAVVPDPAGDTVVVVEGESHRRVPVRVLATSADQALLAGEGLTEGMTVVSKGNERLRPGQPIRVISGDGSAAAEAE